MALSTKEDIQIPFSNGGHGIGRSYSSYLLINHPGQYKLVFRIIWAHFIGEAAI